MTGWVSKFGAAHGCKSKENGSSGLEISAKEQKY
jgi:hypothetical protein